MTWQVTYQVTIDRSQFALSYEASVLSLDKLTPHQSEKLTECLEANESFVHLKAPAGAGKTFVGLHVALDRLQSDSRARLLFVARNEALCLFVVRWICTREKNALRRVQMLRRVFVFFEPFSRGPR